ncbi:hypothetical protein [Priestia aryabhattai]|uniref:hypothetical protein n=1 Tax=Priestia aryabhattai TaxID=412384 RepID=UPI0015F3FDB4|nr:hypothetical protein [Priestia aryabhattai]
MLADFRKAFFPTEEEKQVQVDLLHRLHKERIAKYISQGMSGKEAEEQIDRDVVEFTNRGYYS